MKKIILGIIICSALGSCGKLQDLKPIAPGTSPSVTSVQYADTLALHQVGFDIGDQKVIVSVAGTKLTMLYYENVNLLIRTSGYDESWAVHLFEDFSSASLNAFHYTTVDPAGAVATDWIDNNLNNIGPETTLSDTLVNGQKLIKINVQRTFTFAGTYANNQKAVNEQNLLMGTTGDVIRFSSYIYFVDGDYPTSMANARIVYVKGQ